jgi:acyl carrier protein
VSTLARLQDTFAELLNDPTIQLTDETRFTDLPGWDSLAHVNAMFSIEELFGVTFPGDEFGELETVALLKESLRRKGVTVEGA